MLNLKVTLKRIAAAFIGVVILATSVSTVSYADPPRWAQAHGHQHKHHKKHARHKRHQQRPQVIYVEHRNEDYRDYDDRRSNRIDPSKGGTILGAIFGAAAGTQVGKGKGRAVAILGGAVLGAVLGGEVGRSMEESDRARTQRVLETTPTGQSTAWQNPDTGSRYKVVPTNTYKTGSNVDCRDFTTWAVIDGYEEEIKGTACRQPDGTWKQLKI